MQLDSFRADVGLRVGGIGQLDVRMPASVGRQVAEDAEHGRHTGLVGHQQMLRCRRVEVEAAALVEQRHPIAGLRPLRPAARDPGVAVQHEVHVELAGAGAVVADGVVAQVRADLGRHPAEADVPDQVRLPRHVEARHAGLAGEEKPKPAVVAARRDHAQLVAAEGDPDDVRADPLPSDHLEHRQVVVGPRLPEPHSQARSYR
ncbi:hypothetical protein GCM10022236_04980 [Microlunatus ginsengisoli]|uniref:Uncharacterized protein n=1 Tax=Microlunatus ginsengisoli TaxID=363863 RepID=A0ABP6ZDD2_9ACTN